MTVELRDTSETRKRRLRSGQLVRPPWSTEDSIRDACTSCGACLRACPEAILTDGPARTPVVNFANGECTFCGACAEGCPEDVFAATDTAPWDLVATISGACLLSHGVE